MMPFTLSCHLLSEVRYSYQPHYVVLKCIALIDKKAGHISGLKTSSEYLIKHQSLEILIAIGNDFIRHGVLSIMFFVSLCSVLVNFVTLKLIHIIPMPTCLFFPVMAVIFFGIISVVLPMMINVYENDARILAK